MHSMTAIVILGLSLAVSSVVQAMFFFLIFRAERKFTRDLLNRLASRSVIEYAQATKLLDGNPLEEKDRADDDAGRPIPIFS